VQFGVLLFELRIDDLAACNAPDHLLARALPAAASERGDSDQDPSARFGVRISVAGREIVQAALRIVIYQTGSSATQ
jgi:hypothetical protein